MPIIFYFCYQKLELPHRNFLFKAMFNSMFIIIQQLQNQPKRPMLRIISNFSSKKLHGMMTFEINKSQMFRFIIMPFSDQKMKKVLSQESKQKKRISLQPNIPSSPNQTTNASNSQQVKSLKSKSQNASNGTQNTSQSQKKSSPLNQNKKNKSQINSSISQNSNPRTQSKQNHQQNPHSRSQSKQNNQQNPNSQSQSKQDNQQKKSNSEDSNKTNKPNSDKKQQFKSDKKQQKYSRWLVFSIIGIPGAFYYLDVLNFQHYLYVTFNRQRYTIESLTQKTLTKKIIDRECLDEQLKDPKTNRIYDPDQIFYPTLVSKWAQNFFKNLSKLNNKINVGYGVAGSGKSQGIQRQVNRRRANGEFIYYTHLGRYCGKINDKLGIKNNDNPIALTLDIPERRQIGKWLAQSNLANSQHKKDFLKKLNSKQGITFILDEFNIVEQSISKQFQLYQTLMRSLLDFAQNNIKVVLISSSEGFVRSNQKLTAVSGIRKDKFNFKKIQGNVKKDFEQMFKDMKLSKEATQSILTYHYNFRDMEQSIKMYRDFQGSEQQKLKALQDQLKEQLQDQKGQLSTIINNQQHRRDYMMLICKQSKGISQGDAQEVFQKYNFINAGKFTRKIAMKAFEEYAKQILGMKQPFKCKSKQYYQD